MATINIDTLKLTDQLIAAGIDRPHAEAVVRAIVEAQGALVTKEYFDAKMDLIDAKFDKGYWMLGVLIALNAAAVIKQFL